MHKFKLIDSGKLIESFNDMGISSKRAHYTNKEKLLETGKISITQEDITGHEYLMWLEKKGIARRVK